MKTMQKREFATDERRRFPRLYKVKTDSKGKTVWDYLCGGSYILQSSDGGYVFSRYISDATLIFFSKIDSNRKVVWEQKYLYNPKYEYSHVLGYAEAMSIYQTGDGGYILTGSVQTLQTSEDKIFLIKTDKDGNVK